MSAVACFTGLTVFAAAWAAPPGGGAAPFADFAEAKQTLADALRDRAAAYPRGRATFSCRAHTINKHDGNDFTLRWATDGVVTWAGDLARWDYRHGESLTDAPAELRDSTYSFFLSPSAEVQVQPDQRTVTVRNVAALIPPPWRLQTRPQDSWFHYMGGMRGKSWPEVFDGLTEKGLPEGLAPEFTATADGSAVTISANLMRVGRPAHLTATVILDDAPRVTSWEYFPPDDSYRTTYRSEWERNAAGMLFPARIEALNRHEEGGLYEESFVLTLSDFEADPAVPAKFFDWKSLDLPGGTYVQTLSPQGQPLNGRLAGGRPATAEDRLAELARRLSRSGFAGGGKDGE